LATNNNTLIQQTEVKMTTKTQSSLRPGVLYEPWHAAQGPRAVQKRFIRGHCLSC